VRSLNTKPAGNLITDPCRLRILIVGLGSAHADDQIGWIIADRLKVSLENQPDIAVRRAAVPLDILDWMDDAERLVLCDACECIDLLPDYLNPNYKRWHRFEWTGGRFTASDSEDTSASFRELPAQPDRGSHDFGISVVLRLAETTGQLNVPVTLWAIEGRCFLPDQKLSNDASLNISQAVDAMTRDVIQSCTKNH
jgi:Ni,Fe-hydrogenase maturation factor